MQYALYTWIGIRIETPDPITSLRKARSIAAEYLKGRDSNESVEICELRECGKTWIVKQR